MTERFSQRRLAKIASWIILRQLCSSGCAADKYHFVYAFIYRSYKFMHKVVLEGVSETCFRACGLGGIINPGLLSEILSYGFSTNVCPDAQMCSGTATHFPLHQSFFTTKAGEFGLTQDGVADLCRVWEEGWRKRRRKSFPALAVPLAGTRVRAGASADERSWFPPGGLALDGNHGADQRARALAPVDAGHDATSASKRAKRSSSWRVRRCFSCCGRKA